MRSIKTSMRALARLAAFEPIVLPYAISRAGLIIVAVVTLPHGITCSPCDLSTSTLLNALSRWDGNWYLSIARDGYAYTPGLRSNVTFSPLLPALMRGLAWLSGDLSDGRLLVAGVVVANVALLVALAYLLALGRAELGEAPARRAAVYLLAFPTTIFLSAVYPESLFLACAAGSVFEATRGRWMAAGVLSALGALARPFGVILIIPLAVQAIVDRSRVSGRSLFALALPLPVAAFLGWQAYLYRISGDPLLYFHAQLAYGRQASVPLSGIVDIARYGGYGFPWILATILVLMTALVVLSWRMVHASTASYGTAILLATLSSGTLASFPRYALAIFPGFLVLGALGSHRAFHVVYVVTAAVLAILMTAMFASWHWIG